MSVIEIVLLLIGAGVLLLGYLLPAGKKDVDEEVQLISEAEIRKLVEGEAESVRERISDIVDETISYSIEKTERAMERVANEKIMAVNEYSDTVLEEINKNHKEVTFLYDMLNDKHDTLMASIGQAAQAAEEIRQTVRDAQITADETVKKARDAQEAVESVMDAVEDTRTDLWSLHSAGVYTPEPVEEAQAEVRYGQPETERGEIPVPVDFAWEKETARAPEPVSSGVLYEEPLPEEDIAEEDDFRPISPRRVEIIHEPDADYVAEEPEISTSEAFARLGIFGDMDMDAAQPPAPVPAPDFAPVPEASPRGVDIRFAQGQDNGRNSNERILELHKAGKSNMAIAKELGLGLGEVKLVIDLFEGV